MLRRFDLSSDSVTLPNQRAFRYDRYTVRCCVECNAMMGELVERPVAETVAGGVPAINRFIQEGGLLKLFVWMGLIFLKTHLRDQDFRMDPDLRNQVGQIGDLHAWNNFHHLHCVVRCFYNDCKIDPQAVGSFLALPVRRELSRERFDFADLSHAQTMLLRLDDLGLLAVFNDSCAAMSLFQPTREKIKGAVSEFQLREIMVQLAFFNLHLQSRPTFYSDFDLSQERYRIGAERPPELTLKEIDHAVRGKLMRRAFSDILREPHVPGLTTKEALNAMESGKFTFLFDDNGRFIDRSSTTAHPDARG